MERQIPEMALLERQKAEERVRVRDLGPQIRRAFRPRRLRTQQAYSCTSVCPVGAPPSQRATLRCIARPGFEVLSVPTLSPRRRVCMACVGRSGAARVVHSRPILNHLGNEASPDMRKHDQNA
jgi:hypothetical protein